MPYSMQMEEVTDCDTLGNDRNADFHHSRTQTNNMYKNRGAIGALNWARKTKGSRLHKKQNLEGALAPFPKFWLPE